MHLDGFNLNLLVALDALLGSPTLTIAAQRLSLTQPALSGALRQLREHYGDPLIVFSPGGAKRTQLAEQLAPIVRQILIAIRDTGKLQPSFDPATDSSHLLIAASDWMVLVLLKDLLASVAQAAPAMRITVRSGRPRPARELFHEDADIVVTTGRFRSPGHPAEGLFAERYVCIACAGNDRLATGLSRATFASSPHVGMTDEPDTPPPAAFAAMNAERTITVRTSIHAALPHIIIGTRLLAVTMRRYALQAAAHLPIVVHELPYNLPPLEVFVQLPAWRDHDPKTVWLRSQLRACVERAAPHQPE